LFEEENGRIKINPIVRWSKADIDAYFTAHDLPITRWKPTVISASLHAVH